MATTSGPGTGTSADGTPGRLTLTGRLVLLGLCLLTATLAPAPLRTLLWLGPLTAVAAAAVVLEHRPRLAGPVRALELLVCAAGVYATGRHGSPLLPYLVAPVYAAGATAGAAAAVRAAALAALATGAALGATAAGTAPVRPFALQCAGWVTLALLAGLAGAVVRGLVARAAAGAAETPYEEAYRLLSQLYSVTRHLPGSLDPMAIADRLLETVGGVAASERAAVLVRANGDRLVPLAHRAGGERLDWDTSLRGDHLIFQAWATQTPQVSTMTLPAANGPGEYGSAVVVPIRIGVRTFGVLALDTTAEGAYPDPVVHDIARVVQETALRLATGLLFDEVREVATAEERRRLAREIHDGIAQELASIGYVVDALTGQARSERAGAIEQELADLRQQITRLISEVRLSIFDLRSDVDRHGGLGVALAEYVRTVGTSSELTVHLTLDEEPRRLPAESEAELLRIAQEAVNNARRHAGATNLWVTCRVDPPLAQIVVEDDGRGLGVGRSDSFGLEIMRERAARLGARLDVRRRTPRGTRVEVVIGPAPDPVAEAVPTAAGSAHPPVAGQPADGRRTPDRAGVGAGAGAGRAGAGRAPAPAASTNELVQVTTHRDPGGIRDANDSAAG